VPSLLPGFWRPAQPPAAPIVHNRPQSKSGLGIWQLMKALTRRLVGRVTLPLVPAGKNQNEFLDLTQSRSFLPTLGLFSILCLSLTHGCLIFWPHLKMQASYESLWLPVYRKKRLIIGSGPARSNVSPFGIISSQRWRGLRLRSAVRLNRPM